MENILTSQTLWETFDPNAEQLESDTIKTWQQNGVTVKNMYFTGRTFDNGQTRVFGTVCYCRSSENKPAVLVIGDFDKQVDVKLLIDLAKRGFVAMAVDLFGRKELGLYTLFSEQLDYCNSDKNVSIFEIAETAHDTKLYEFTVCCRRAITYLLTEENVSEISVLAQGSGTYVGIIALGSDSRIARGVLLFGNLYKNFPAPQQDAIFGSDDDEDLHKHIAYDAKRQMWTLGLAPQTYVSQIQVPLYIVNSANSEYVDIVETSRTFIRANADSRLLILPTGMDYLNKQYTHSVVRWLGGQQVDKPSEIKTFTDPDGDLCLSVATDKPLSKVSVWYCADNVGHARHWNKAVLSGKNGEYSAKAIMYAPKSTLLAFALFDGDIATSSCLLEQKVVAANVKKSNNIIFSGNLNQTLVPASVNGDWWDVDLQPTLDKGYLGIVGAKGKALATFAVSDKSIRINPSFTVGFDICCNVRQQLTIVAVCNFGEANDKYIQTAPVAGSGKWERLTFDKENFHRTMDGKQLSVGERVDMLLVYADNEFIINNIFLV